MSWASRRKFVYIFGIIVFFSLIIFVLAYPYIFKDPTCSDGKKNGNELGIDCGGACESLCKDNLSEPVVVWSRAFPVVGNIYNLVALVENKNRDAAVSDISYVFKIYDENNVLIGTKEGTTYIPPSRQFAVFEPRFDSGGVSARRVTFEFVSPYLWVKKSSDINTLPIVVDNVVFNSEENGNSSLTARVNNNSIYDIPTFDVVAILYDKDHNAVNISRTRVKGLFSNENADLFFTWFGKFDNTPVNQDILVQINPFDVSF